MAGLEAIVCVNSSSRFVDETLHGLARFADYIAVWDVDRKLGMDLWPIWVARNGGDAPCVSFDLQDRSKFTFKRWGKVTWLPGENKRFACN